MKRMLYYVIAVAVIIAIGAVCIAFASDENARNIEFLQSYGWEVEENCIEMESLQIPKVFDDVYNNYNELQKIAGLDLSKYKGQNAVRYTYIVKNFPQKTSEPVRANVLYVGGEPIAGDVMTVSLDGFMYSLAYLEVGK